MIIFPYTHEEAVRVPIAASKLKAQFPEIAITLTERALELHNVPLGMDEAVMQAAALHLIAARHRRLRAAA